ncbi:MAG TPA: phospho-sugar mutase [Clostridia bacterium]|nr:phospho-sugar mutase [Clostridia bacterium]
MNYRDKYNLWLTFDESTKKELLSIKDEKEIEDRFYKNLAFGTGGLRGVMGAGANRMNKYTVGKATLGLANYLKAEYGENISVAVAYDSRNNSKEFSFFVASVLNACSIKVFIFDYLAPTPVLSFAVRQLNCNAGVVITASHNPKEYNGYKIYDNEGCQLVPKFANRVTEHVNAVDNFMSIPFMDINEAKQQNLIKFIGGDILDDFISAIKEQSLYNEKSDLKIIYTPLHGTGNIPVRRALEGMNLSIVKTQELPDGNFSTVSSPNPEERDALNLAIEQAMLENADIVLGTDPDCDRVGVGVRHKGEFVLLTGNQIGALLVNFVLNMKKDSLNNKSTLIKTIVTNELGANIGRRFGLSIVETLTGFKYIGDIINLYEQTGEKEFVIGYEESYGYLVGTHARDKDAVVSSMLICEMAAFYKNRDKTLIDVLNDIYDEYGFYLDALDAFVLKGKDGAEKIKLIMSEFRSKGSEIFGNVKEVKDYSTGIDNLPKENVLKFIFDEGTWLAVRPSGTEPKLKVYYSVRSSDKASANAELDKLKATVGKIIGQ